MSNKNSRRKEKMLKTSPQTEKVSLQTTTETGVRAFLDRNKIFFETLAATTLTIMAVIVAIAQLVITNKQTEYLEQQTTIERSQALPQFAIQANQVMNEEGTFAEDDRLMIYNHGNIAYNIKIDTAVFFKLSYSFQNKYKELLIPISGYYAGNMYTGDQTGLIISSWDAKNNYKRFNLQNQLFDLEKENGKSINIEVKRYAKIIYTDIFQDDHIEYYYVPIIYGGELLEVSEGEKIFSEYNDGRSNGTMFDINDLTPDILYDLFQ